MHWGFVPGGGLPHPIFGVQSGDGLPFGGVRSQGQLWGQQRDLGGQASVRLSENSSHQCLVARGRWLWGASPASPGPGTSECDYLRLGILGLPVGHGTAIPLSPQGTVSRGVTVQAAVTAFQSGATSLLSHLPWARGPLPLPFTHVPCHLLVNPSDLLGVHGLSLWPRFRFASLLKGLSFFSRVCVSSFTQCRLKSLPFPVRPSVLFLVICSFSCALSTNPMISVFHKYLLPL